MLWWTLQQLKSSNWEKRAEAAARLRDARDKKSVPALVKALEDGHAAVRLEVVRALAEVAHPAAAEPLAKALAGLARRKQESRGQQDSKEYEAIALALGALQGAAVPPVLDLLDSEDKEVRRWAAHALGLTRDARAVGPLVRHLSDSRSDARRAAALALGAIGDPAAIAPLMQALAGRDAETRRAAALALGSIGSDQAVDSLCRAAEDPNEPVQLAVAEALGRIGGLRSAAGLRTIIDGGKKNVREAAGAALAALKLTPVSATERAAAAVLRGHFQEAAGEGEAAVGALVTAMNSKDARRRQQAAETLGVLCSAAATETLLRALNDNEAAVRQAARSALVKTGSLSVPGLMEMMSHPNPTVQCLAAQALGEIGDPLAVPALAALVEQNAVIANEYKDVVEGLRAAAEALAAIAEKCPDALAAADLQRLAALADPRLQFAPEGAVDCRPVRDLALQELQRRGS